MPRAKKDNPDQARGFSPAIDPEEREKQLIALADRLAERKLRDGTASNSLILHYISLSSTKAELEKEKLRYENNLLEAKTQAIKSAARTEELYQRALNAMKSYSGSIYSDDDYDE